MFKNILDYAEGPKGVTGMRLYPVQRFLLKLNHGIELDKKLPRVASRQIQITDHFRERVLWKFSETEYLHYLYDEGRCNIREQESSVRSQLFLCGGRRMGMTWIAALTAGWEALRLLKLDSHLPITNSITIVNHSKDMAEVSLSNVFYDVERCRDLKGALVSSTMSKVSFQTPSSKKGRKTKANIQINCFSPALRVKGISNTLVIFDGVAYFPHADETVDAYLPTLVSKRTVLMLSNPAGACGRFYSSFTHAMNSGHLKDPLAIMIPSWEGNPTLPSSFLKEHYARDPIRFRTDYGARFASLKGS